MTSAMHTNSSANRRMNAASERIGRIVAVTGAHAIILLDADDAFSATAETSPEIGTLLKVDTENTVTLALVSALSSPTPSHENQNQEMRIVEVEFIGELPKDEEGNPKSFRRGVSCYPGLGNVVSRASQHELAMAYAADHDSSIRIGHIQQDPSIPAMVKIDDLLGKHFAVLGTTGTGKSCSVALILRRILEKNPKAHILLLDMHREYAASFPEYAEVIQPQNMQLPFWLLNFEEIVEIIIGNQPNREQDIEILRELIPLAKQRYSTSTRRDKSPTLRSHGSGEMVNVGVDTPVPYRSSDLIGLLEEYLGKLELKGELAPFKRLKARLDAITRDPRYAFMFGQMTISDNMAEVVGRIFRIPVNDKPITVLELGGLPSEVINVCVSVLARMAFDFGLWSQGRVPITFVCEEAHRYVPIDKTTGFEPTKRAISRIAKEGRKYGVSLAIISQRPAELDPTILSQCNTVFSMRLTNERDQEILKAGISDAAASLMEFMPTMGTGEAVTFGEGVSLPTRIKFDLLPSHALPKSSTASFTRNWAIDVPEDGFLEAIVARWRQQSYAVEYSDSAGNSANLQLEPAVGTPVTANAPAAPAPAQQPAAQHAPVAAAAEPPAAPAATPAPAPAVAGAGSSLLKKPLDAASLGIASAPAAAPTAPSAPVAAPAAVQAAPTAEVADGAIAAAAKPAGDARLSSLLQKLRG
jgi:DNA helicase HerA-like ATPase